jgi:hypothetical protein
LLNATVQVLTAPEARLEGLQLSAETVAGATNVSVLVAEVELAEAETTAVASAVTALTVAAKVAVVAPAATVTDAGSETEALLSDNVTAVPPVGAATLKVTVQLDVPAALKEVGEQLSELTVGTMVAVSVIEAVRLTEFAVAVTVAVLPVVMVPAVAEKVAVVAPDATVTEAGTVKVVLLSEIASAKPPDGAALLNVTVQVLAAPEARLEGLQLSAEGVAGATKVSVLVAEVELAVAVTTAVASAVTALTVAANVAVVEPAATVTDAGSETEALLSERFTAVPPVGAATDKVTVQLDVPAALKEVGVQLRELTVGTTGAVRAMEAVRLTEFAAAVTVAVLPVVMVPAAAEKVAVVAPDATVTEAGTVRLALLSERVTA